MNSVSDFWRETPRSAGRSFRWVWLHPYLAELTNWRTCWSCKRETDAYESHTASVEWWSTIIFVNTYESLKMLGVPVCAPIFNPFTAEHLSRH